MGGLFGGDRRQVITAAVRAYRCGRPSAEPWTALADDAPTGAIDVAAPTTGPPRPPGPALHAAQHGSAARQCSTAVQHTTPGPKPHPSHRPPPRRPPSPPTTP